MPQDPNYIDNYSPEKMEEIEKQAAEHLKNIDLSKRNSAVPPPPKKGEIIHCQMCRKPMMPEDFSKDKDQRRWEFKWQVHWQCKIAAEEYLDRATTGLLSERRQKQRRGQ